MYLIGSKIIETDSLIAKDDSRLLFNISGGVKYQIDILFIVNNSKDNNSTINEIDII